MTFRRLSSDRSVSHDFSDKMRSILEKVVHTRVHAESGRNSVHSAFNAIHAPRDRPHRPCPVSLQRNPSSPALAPTLSMHMGTGRRVLGQVRLMSSSGLIRNRPLHTWPRITMMWGYGDGRIHTTQSL